MRFVVVILAIAATLLALPPSARAAAADSAATLYALETPPSALQTGCLGPCACPVVAQPLYGSFTLTRTAVGPFFVSYAVDRFIASFNNGPGAVMVTGSGTYRIGGEVALQQQLVLDLVIEGRPAQHFDSGLVPVTTPFPAIALACSTSVNSCFDSVLVVSARPVATTGVSGAGSTTAVLGARPDPFRGRTRVEAVLSRPGALRIEVVDVSGRRVRTLGAWPTAAAGPLEVEWDGRRDDGSRAPAGVYWIELRSASGDGRRRIVKLD